MILYHFTDFYALQNGGTILKEGLKPGAENQGDAFGPYNVVWLTTDDDFKLDGKQRSECRIKLVIPSMDRRLVRWEKWLRKHEPHIIEMLAECDCGFDHMSQMLSTYVYFGDVPLSMFRAIEHADPEKREAAR